MDAKTKKTLGAGALLLLLLGAAKGRGAKPANFDIPTPADPDAADAPPGATPPAIPPAAPPSDPNIKLDQPAVSVETTGNPLIGELVTKNRIQFLKASAVLSPASKQTLDAVAKILDEQAPTMLLKIEGHTSSEGDKAFNMKLSQKRANAVMAYLITRGIAPARMSAFGYGSTYPLPSLPDGPTTPPTSPLNRRVAFFIARNQEDLLKQN